VFWDVEEAAFGTVGRAIEPRSRLYDDDEVGVYRALTWIAVLIDVEVDTSFEEGGTGENAFGRASA
jgi:hypothetical protein